MQEASSTILHTSVRCRKAEVRCLKLSSMSSISEVDGTSEDMLKKAGETDMDFGFVALKGRRPEMEDAVGVVPNFMPGAHFFGVYDGHGGAQVSNYCCARLHLAMLEELENTMGLDPGSMDLNLKSSSMEVWKEASRNCFSKIDGEVGGLGGVEMETVGSTAVIAITSSSHIMVANCGDSRALLCRGRKPVPLSVDHKPDREDEMTRIEAAGGKIIRWDGVRVFGVLSMSRAIGDAYLKPWISPVPEVTLTKRNDEDECLIIASDGLWDVVSNDEACEVARRCLRRRRSKSGVRERGKDKNSPANVAAEYLARLSLQRGSRDNISVVVVDLSNSSRINEYKM